MNLKRPMMRKVNEIIYTVYNAPTAGCHRMSKEHKIAKIPMPYTSPNHGFHNVSDPWSSLWQKNLGT